MRADDENCSAGANPAMCAAEAEPRKTAPPVYAGTPLGVVFMGTPDFAATILKRILEACFLTVRAVFTRPDKPAGRGRKPGVSPVKALALERSLPVFQPRSFIRGPETDAAACPLLAGPAPDLLITAAYGLILPRHVLDIPKLGAINVHASLLPLYRGAAPVHRALADGVRCTGVSIMRMTEELDAGPVLMQRAVAVAPNDTCGGLLEELAGAGADLLIECLQRLAARLVRPVEQDAARATFAPKITDAECRADFSLPASVLHNRIRGLHPRPGTYMLLRRKDKDDLRVLASPGIHPLTPAMRAFLERRRETSPADAAGRILGLSGGALLVACGDGAYAFTRLRPAGKADMEATAFYNGYLAGRPEAAFVDAPGARSVSS
ncbi:MAG: methionyl-tRNA formyltransferase [Desulfovibrio sp.]|jgi:methionyl-tRNA formyltransferase|nr:methionyl-tRNA formyltransferase [Desulfovibrio sp.]